MSTWLPVIAAKNLDNILTVDMKNKISIYNDEALERLYGYQHHDGGWGWWKNDSTSSFMTAYVMFGFYLAEKAGIELNNDVIKNGARILGYMMNNNRDPFVQYVYTLYDNSPDLVIQKYGSDLASVALTALALKNVGKRQEAIQFIEKAWDFIKFDDNNLEVKQNDSFSYFFESDLSLLMLFKVINELDYDEELVVRIGQAIFNRNNGGRWDRTITTCLAVSELSDFSKSVANEKIKYIISDSSGLIDNGFMDDSTSVRIEISPELRSPISISTEGNAFNVVNSKAKYSLDSVEPLSNGMTVTRFFRKEVEITSRNSLVEKTFLR
ncbi:MAG: hypothetical protein U9O65_00315 [Thermotogota bacterium]|nr:hypothetical protein [Thermotogota bacterium]